MKQRLQCQSRRSLLIFSLALLAADRVSAQTFTNLHRFTGGSDGANPYAGLTLSGGTLYGTAYQGGSSGKGTVFKVNDDGTGFTTLHGFTGSSDGANPYAGPVLFGNTLYGTASAGGDSSYGTVFKINIDGTGFTTLHGFTDGGEGVAPEGGLTLSSNTLYGTTFSGGGSGRGTVFKVNTDGTGFTTLFSFSGSDGSLPAATLTLSGATLYGTTFSGGDSGYGTVFRINADGTSFTTLYSFTGDADGARPYYAPLILSGGKLFGTTYQRGSSGKGTVFRINTDGMGFTILQSFTNGSDGATPIAGLTLSGTTLYGVAAGGGISPGGSGNGTVFQISTDGTGFTTLYSFTGGSDGGYPTAGLILSGSTLYGTTYQGGSLDHGTIFSFSLGSVGVPSLAIALSQANAIITWPTNVTGFTLQSITNLTPPAVWAAVSPQPVVVNGQNTVTNPISGTQQFYRLNQ